MCERAEEKVRRGRKDCGNNSLVGLSNAGCCWRFVMFYCVCVVEVGG